MISPVPTEEVGVEHPALAVAGLGPEPLDLGGQGGQGSGQQDLVRGAEVGAPVDGDAVGVDRREGAAAVGHAPDVVDALGPTLLGQAAARGDVGGGAATGE